MAVPRKPGRPKKQYDSSNRPPFEKMQGVYMRAVDMDRTNRMIYIGKLSRKLPPRLGVSMLVRAGLLLLEREMDKNEQKFIDLVNESHSEALEPAE